MAIGGVLSLEIGQGWSWLLSCLGGRPCYIYGAWQGVARGSVGRHVIFVQGEEGAADSVLVVFEGLWAVAT